MQFTTTLPQTAGVGRSMAGVVTARIDRVGAVGRAMPRFITSGSRPRMHASILPDLAYIIHAYE